LDKRWFFPLPGTIVLMTMAACASSPPTPDIDPTQGVEMLSGTYQTTITEADLATFTKSADPGLLGSIGVWQFEMLADGTFTAAQEGTWFGGGKYTVTGNEIEIFVDQVCEGCGCLRSIDRYVWALEDDRLLLRHIAGTCTGMELVVTAHGLTRTP